MWGNGTKWRMGWFAVRDSVKKTLSKQGNENEVNTTTFSYSFIWYGNRSR
jgi:hypothetical protein